MDLFEMLEPEVSQAPPVDIVNELNMIIKQHGFNLPGAVLEDLASYYIDPPPWAPWTK